MEKVVKVDVGEALNLRERGDGRIFNMIEALKGGFADAPYRLSYAGVMHEGKGGHTEVEFRNQELFKRFSKASHVAQKQFLEGVEQIISRERTGIFIDAEWGVGGKRRLISALVDEGARPRRLIFNLT